MTAAHFSRARRVRFAVIAALMTVSAAALLWRPAVVWWQLRTARHQLRDGDINAALVTLDGAQRLSPGSAEVLFTLGRAHRRAGDLKQAMPYLQRAFEAGWSPEDLRHQRYLAMIQTGRMDDAEPYLNEVLSTTTDDEIACEVYEAIARGHMSAYRFQDALLCLNHFISWQPDAVTPRLWRAEIHQRMGNWQAARDEYQAVVSEHPDEWEARRALAGCLLQLHQADAALREYQRCLNGTPDDVQAMLGVASAMWKQGNSDDAEAGFLRVLEHDLTPEIRVEALTGLAQVANLARQYERATELLEEALLLKPFDPPANHLLGTIYTLMGRQDEAAAQLAKAREHTKQISRFGAILQELFERPADPDLRFEAGSILITQGDDENGVAWMATALLIDPNHQPTHAALAEHHAQAGNSERAAQHRRMLDGAVLLDSDSAAAIRDFDQ